MLPLLRCAVVIGTIYALSPVRDPGPDAAAAAAAAAAQAEAAAKAWSHLPEATRRAVAEEVGRQVVEGARAAVSPGARPAAPEKPPR